jgi:cyanophycinase
MVHGSRTIIDQLHQTSTGDVLTFRLVRFVSAALQSSTAGGSLLRKIIALLFLPGLALASDSGNLVIAGGASASDNKAIYREFVDTVGPSARIAIVTAASDAPVESAIRIRSTLESVGVVRVRMVIVRLAIEDDRSTPLVDEREWSENAFDLEEIQKLAKVGGIWFSDGDQSRITQALMVDGEATPMLRMIQSRYRAGAVVGGTGAGAAMMSNPMITRGESIATLLDTTDVGERLAMSPGLGFFDGGIVDQYFDAGARLGRLAVAIQSQPVSARIGYGVDENTALVLDGRALRVVGEGQVTIVDGRDASWRKGEAGYEVAGLKLTILSPGDRFYRDRWVLNPASYLRPTRGNEYFREKPSIGGGIALPRGSLSAMLGENLVDNAVTSRYSAISFAMVDDQRGVGVRYTFNQREETRAYTGRDDSGAERYTIVNVGFDVQPLSLVLDGPSTGDQSSD